MHDADNPAVAVLDVLLSRHPALVAFDDLVRELTEAPEQRVLREEFIRDGVSDLVGDGLAVRLDRFVLPTRAAVRAYVLLGSP